jgi:nucleotide-binding universal stress UspA family protein
LTTIVVGVDDSTEAAAALRWAAEEARLRGARLLVVHAWDWPYREQLGEIADEALDSKGFAAAAETVLATIVQAALGDDMGDVPLEQHTEEGAPARVLLAAARSADLLVVGARGRGGFHGLRLGSVSQHCARHAPCPVVIVPTAPD